MKSQIQVAIIGIGNVFLGDDGFGPLAVEMFRCTYECGLNVEIHDLGTPGLDLAPYLYGRDLVVIVDAIHADDTPGTMRLYCEGDFLAGHARLRLTGHDPGVWESLAHLRLAGHAPSEVIILGVVPESCAFGMGVSAPVLSNYPAAVEALARLLAERGIDCDRRSPPAQPNLWWLSEDGYEFAATA